MDTHITQNNKFAISLQYRKNEVSDEVDILCADKHESLMQFGTMILMRIAKYSQSSQKTSLQCLAISQKKKLETKLILCMQINIKVSYRLVSTLWASRFPTR